MMQAQIRTVTSTMTLALPGANGCARGIPLPISKEARDFARGEISRDDTASCDACGSSWPMSLLDGKGERLECPLCYGPDWLPMI